MQRMNIAVFIAALIQISVDVLSISRGQLKLDVGLIVYNSLRRIK